MDIRAGGYVPSSSAADDYIDALKVDSRRRTAVMQNKLNGRDVPPENQEPVNVPEPYAPPTKVCSLKFQGNSLERLVWFQSY